MTDTLHSQLATERERFNQLAMFLGSDTALFLASLHGIFEALAEWPGDMDYKGAGRIGLERVSKFEKECQALLEALTR